MDTLRNTYNNDDEDDDASDTQTNGGTDVQPHQLHVQSHTNGAAGEHGRDEHHDDAAEFPPNKKQKSNLPTESDSQEQTLVHDVQPQHLQVQSHSTGPNISLEQTLIHPLKMDETSKGDEHHDHEGEFSSKEIALITDVQPDQLHVQQPHQLVVTPSTAKSSTKKSKKKNNNVWTRPTSRKGKKKAKTNQNNGNQSNANHTNVAAAEERVFISPVPKFPDKNDDNPEINVCLSKFYKAEKVEISEDRLSAGSTKGYRIMRATRGVVEGAWYFEIKVLHLGETGDTRLGWSTEKGDLQAPVGFDGNSFGYRDIDGSKVHKALREKYGEEGYGEGHVLGFYISLPDGSSFAPKPPRYVWFKGQRYVCAPDVKEDPPKVVPGSEICFFKNGICQGTAFTDLFGGRYYPAASMYTLPNPNQSNCLVRFNFGPDFDSFPEDFGGRPVPKPMIEVAYHGCDGRPENGNGSLWNSTRTSTMLKVTKEQGTLFVEASELDRD